MGLKILDGGGKGKEKKERKIPFPQVVNGLGEALTELGKGVEKDTLKPLIGKDLLPIVYNLHMLQQMDVIAYTLAVQNYELMQGRIIKLEEAIIRLDKAKK